MESNQLNNTSSEEALFELLTLTYEVFPNESKRYYNKEGKVHRIYGPAVIYEDGSQFWYRNGKRHCERGPAIIWGDGEKEYFINGEVLTEKDFIQWQKDYEIKPIK